jgi:hypothetical protein
MSVLSVIVIVFVVLLISYAVNMYDQYLRERYSNTILSAGKLICLTILEGIVACGGSTLIVIILVIIFIIFVDENIKIFGFLHGLLVSIIQFIAAAILVLLFILILTSDNRRKKH